MSYWQKYKLKIENIIEPKHVNNKIISVNVIKKKKIKSMDLDRTLLYLI